MFRHTTRAIIRESSWLLSARCPIVSCMVIWTGCFAKTNNTLYQICTNPGRQVAQAIKFCKVTPNICGHSVWIWRLNLEICSLDIWENLCIPALTQHLVEHEQLFETYSIQDLHGFPVFGSIPMSMWLPLYEYIFPFPSILRPLETNGRQSGTAEHPATTLTKSVSTTTKDQMMRKGSIRKISRGKPSKEYYGGKQECADCEC